MTTAERAPLKEKVDLGAIDGDAVQDTEGASTANISFMRK